MLNFLIAFIPFYFIHYSDPQIGVNGDLARQNMATAVGQINALTPQPRFLISAGDQANNPENFTLVQDQWRVCDSLFDLLSIPVRVAPGNNDLGYEDEGCWTPALLQAYRNFWGMDYYSFDSDSCHFIGLNSTLLDTYSGHACYSYSLSQDSFLANDLPNTPPASYRHLFMFFHFPLYQNSPAEGNSHNVVDRPRRDTVLADLIRYQAAAVFTGHWHMDWMNFYGPSLLETGITTNQASNCGYRIVKVLDNGVETFHVLLSNPMTGVSLNRIVTADLSPDTVQTGQTVNFTCSVDSVNNPTWQGLSYYWAFGDGDSALTTNPSHIFADSGHYRVIFRAYKIHDLCALYYLPVVVTSGQEVTENINDRQNTPDFRLIGGIVKDDFIFYLPEQNKVGIYIYQADGRLVMSKNLGIQDRGRNRFELSRSLTPGIYFVRISVADRSIVGKLIKL